MVGFAVLDVTVIEFVIVGELEPEDLEDDAVNWYNDRPFDPPQISRILPAHAIEHLPSVAAVEPAVRELPQ